MALARSTRKSAFSREPPARHPHLLPRGWPSMCSLTFLRRLHPLIARLTDLPLDFSHQGCNHGGTGRRLENFDVGVIALGNTVEVVAPVSRRWHGSADRAVSCLQNYTREGSNTTLSRRDAEGLINGISLRSLRLCGSQK